MIKTFLLAAMIVFLSTACQYTNPEQSSNSEEACWSTADVYFAYIGVPISESTSQYTQWESIGIIKGFAYFKDSSDVYYIFDYTNSDNMIGDILTGEEVCRGVGSSLLSFFPSLEIDDDVEKTKQMLLEYLNIELQWGTDEDEESELLYAQLDDMPFDKMIIYAKDRVIDGNNFTTFMSSAMSYHITIMGMRNSCYIT